MVILSLKVLLTQSGSHPNKEMAEYFSDLIPISHNDFINKVISIVIHDRIEKVLQKMIFSNHSGFVKGRGIIEMSF